MVEKLRNEFRGALLRPGEEGYHEGRRIWNGAIDRHPALIARCAGADDVLAAVRFARERDMLVSVKGGGHAVAGHAVCDGGLMIDLSLMNGVRVDPSARTARGAGGALWSDLDRATQRFGLATTGGIVTHTGIGGLTLGGGLGHLMRRFGLTVDNVLAVDLVTADGQRLHVNAETEPELFWGLRGGGGNFGIATSFSYRLHPVGPMVLGGRILWPLADAPAVLRTVADFMAAAPDELNVIMRLGLAPPLPFVPTEQYGKPVLGLEIVWCGDPGEGARVIAPLRAIGTPIVDLVRPVPYLFVQSQADAGNPHGRHYYWRSQRLPVLTDDVIDVLLAHTEAVTSPMSYIGCFVMGGAVTRVDPDATAVGRRDPGFEVNAVAAWSPSEAEGPASIAASAASEERSRPESRPFDTEAEGPASIAASEERSRPESRPFDTDLDGGRHVAWVRGFADAMRPYSTGVYANFMSDEDAAGVAWSYGSRLKRLTALKDRYDPTNFFRLNANVPPSGGRP